MTFYAHSANDTDTRHLLTDHLMAVAEMARAFAPSFGGGDLAYYVGLWHDLGKFADGFAQPQRAIETQDTLARGVV